MDGVQGVSETAPPSIRIRALRGAVVAAATERVGAAAVVAFRAAVDATGAEDDVERGFGDSVLLPPIANTCSCEARPPPEDVGVPPTVIAMYSFPSAVKIVGPAAICRPVWNVQRTFPFVRSKARRTPSPPPAKPSPLAVTVTPPRSGSGVLNFQTRRPVDALIALIEP